MPTLYAGQLVELELAQSADGGSALVPSRVRQADGRTIDVAVSTREGAPVNVPVGASMRLWHKQMGETYSVRAKVAGRVAAPIPVYRLELTGEWERMQRRNAVRLSVGISPLEAWLLREGAEPQRVDVLIDDLSIGGAFIRWRQTDVLDESEPETSRLKLRFDLGDGQEPMELTGVFRRRVIQEKFGRKQYRVGVEFEDMERRQEDRIMRFIFRQELERKRKGIL
ncbi:MAG: PilZ domain-containing protein [Chloroflexi bacterium]|nr:PilZ domain-containing protein [Chloroflexota bacterium]